MIEPDYTKIDDPKQLLKDIHEMLTSIHHVNVAVLTIIMQQTTTPERYKAHLSLIQQLVHEAMSLYPIEESKE